MRLRRLSEHIRSQNWVAVLIDFLIVVFGVFLGLQVQDWNQQRMDQSREAGYLARLSSDFASIDSQLGQCLSVYRDSLKAIDFVSQLADAVARPEGRREPERDILADTLIRLTAESIPAGRSATFVEMLSAGELGILRSDGLRNALIAYDQEAQTNRALWQSAREGMGAYLRPLYEHVDLRVDPESRPYASIPAVDLESMAGDRGFHTMLKVLAGSKGNNHELCQRQSVMANRVRELIDGGRPSN